VSIFGGVEHLRNFRAVHQRPRELGEGGAVVSRKVPRGGLRQVNLLNDLAKSGTIIFPHDHYAFWRECSTPSSVPRRQWQSINEAFRATLSDGQRRAVVRPRLSGFSFNNREIPGAYSRSGSKIRIVVIASAYQGGVAKPGLVKQLRGNHRKSRGHSDFAAYSPHC
jgi:hypothetical protein